MKVLLLGEFSALHKNLKEGLVELGHEVILASSGDAFKKINSDIDLGSSKSRFLGEVEKVIKILTALPKLKNYDVVQFVAPVLLPRFLKINSFIVKYILKNNKKVFLVGAGATPQNSIIADYLETGFKYQQLYSEIKKMYPAMWSQTPVGRDYNCWFLDRINGFIPIMYEYAQGYRDVNYPKLCPTIPIPMNLHKIEYKDNPVDRKIVIFHGLNREGLKGTPLIKQAMEKLQQSYPDSVECIIDGKMPLDEYLQLLCKASIVIDQVYSASVGVNGVYSLAMGKVVVGGGEPEMLQEFGISSSPLVPIQPNSEDIYCQLQRLVENKKDLITIGKASRAFAEDIHDYKKVAQQYVDVWEKF